jgi:cytochrome P450
MVQCEYPKASDRSYHEIMVSAAQATLPPVLRGQPLLGNLLGMRQDPIEMFMRASRMGEIVQLIFPTRVAHLLTRSEHIKHVLVDNHKNYDKQTRGYHVLRFGLGNGLLTSEGEFWKRQRRIAQPSFHHGRIAGFGAIMTECTGRMIDRWDESKRDGKPFDLAAEMMALTLQIVGLCLMSTDLSDASDRVAGALSELLHLTVDRITRPFAPPMFVPTPKNRAYKRALAQLDRVVFDIIAERRRTNEEKNDLLDMLMRARDEETNEGMTDRQLRDEVLTLVLAGHETTANALNWSFFLLSRNPSARERLERELADVLGDRPPRIEDLHELRYTEAVIKESMRLFPPAWLTARRAIEEDEIGGVVIPEHSMVFLSPYVTHRLPLYFENPEGFFPERFLDGKLEELPKYAYFPFGGGPRICIGNAFAMMEAKLLLAQVAQRYRLDLLAGHPVIAEPVVTLRPKYGLQMVARKRRL